jgi:hypothetical protein
MHSEFSLKNGIIFISSPSSDEKDEDDIDTEHEFTEFDLNN